jgi:hypothetical protein
LQWMRCSEKSGEECKRLDALNHFFLISLRYFGVFFLPSKSKITRLKYGQSAWVFGY